jgi:hypothetical protein
MQDDDSDLVWLDPDEVWPPLGKKWAHLNLPNVGSGNSDRLFPEILTKSAA